MTGLDRQDENAIGAGTLLPASWFLVSPVASHKDTPHTFTTSASEGARFLLVTEPAGFDGSMRSGAEAANALTLSPAPSQPPDPERLGTPTGKYGIEILGLPGLSS